VIALVAVGLLTSKSYADVQNIRLSGDIRIRGYFLSKADFGNDADNQFITQRTRVTCEADLEDHVLAVVTLRAEGMWGAENESIEGSAGAGALPIGLFRINRGFDVGINEAYVQLSEVFYTPATLKIGRQYLNYGNGLIISSAEGEYNFDAVRLVLDYYPLTIDLVYAKSFEGSVFGLGGGYGAGSLTSLLGIGGDTGDANMLFLNARYELTDSLVKDVEMYFGFMDNGVNLGKIGPIPLTTVPWVPPTALGASPLIVGMRTDLNLTKNLNAWFEGAYEWGTDGSLLTETISAGLINAGLRFSVKDCQWTPTFNATYTYATGGGDEGQHYFRPWFDYRDGYNGYVFHPMLSNIHILNVGAAVKPAKNTTLAVQAYYYIKADADGFAFSNPNVDTGLTGMIAANTRAEVGWELDAILGYDYSKDVRCQLVYGVFIPEKGIRETALPIVGGQCSAVAHGLRGEINVKF
jgi:hypothetical protein